MTPSAKDLTFLPTRHKVRVRKGAAAQAHFRARGGCKTQVHSAAVNVNPRDGLYHDDSAGSSAPSG